MKRTDTKKKLLVSVSVVFVGLIGVYLLASSRAATPPASFESESGNAVSPATTINDSSASSGKAVTFNTAASGGAVTHGQQITTANTGYLAWVGPNGERCTDSNIIVYNTSVNASSLGGSKTCVYFKGGLTIDAPITLTACKMDDNAYTSYDYIRTVLNYCTINPSTVADWSLGPGNFTATRCQILGSSDGVRFASNYNDTLIENYIRLKAQSSSDHNDGIQMYGATGGGTMLRNNIDARPIGGGGGPNAALFIADGATGTYEIRDNYLAGGGFSLRLHESGYYKVTGNTIEKNSYDYGPVSTSAAITGAFLEWSNNRLSDGSLIASP